MYICYMKTGIYKITNLINNKVYIGSSALDYKARFRQHRYLLKNNKHFNTHLQAAYNKYGEENFKFSIVEYCDVDVLYEKENYYIKEYKSTDITFGYNKGFAIIGTLGYKMSPEAKSKMSAAKKGTTMHINTKKAIIEANKKRVYKSGHKQSKETVEKRISFFRKPVLQYDLNGNFIQKFNSVKEAASTVNIKNPTCISSCILGKRNKSGGFIWRKAESDLIPLKIKHTKVKSLKKEIYQYDLNFNLISKFESIKELAKFLNKSATYIKTNLIYKQCSYQGYIYKY